MLSDICVLDISRYLPGPLATMWLGDMGADVIKIESPTSPDPTRFIPPFQNGIGLAFLNLNRSKRSLALDLKSPKGREVFLRLVLKADVIVEGFRPGVMDRLGLGYTVLTKEKSDIILCSISGYGQTGPDRDKAGHDINYIARSGALATTGCLQGDMALPGFQLADVAGGSFPALAGILGALFQRERTGQGQWIDISMADGALAPMLLSLLHVFHGAELPPPGAGELTGDMPCYGLYETSDGRSLALGALEPQFFDRFCMAAQCPELKGQGLTKGDAGRLVREKLQAKIKEAPLNIWIERLEKCDACVEPVWNGAELMEHPQYKERQMFFQLDHPQAGRLWQLSNPLKLKPAKNSPILPPPCLGEHSKQILSKLNLSEEEIQELMDSNVVA